MNAKKSLPEPRSSSYLAALASEAEAVATGAEAAARVAELELRPDGSPASRREIDPETDRAEAARNFAIRSEVARVRRRLDLSQDAFARRLGIPLSTVRKWERNATVPTGAAAALIRILDRRPDVIEALEDSCGDPK